MSRGELKEKGGDHLTDKVIFLGGSRREGEEALRLWEVQSGRDAARAENPAGRRAGAREGSREAAGEASE